MSVVKPILNDVSKWLNAIEKIQNVSLFMKLVHWAYRVFADIQYREDAALTLSPDKRIFIARRSLAENPPLASPVEQKFSATSDIFIWINRVIIFFIASIFIEVHSLTTSVRDAEVCFAR